MPFTFRRRATAALSSLAILVGAAACAATADAQVIYSGALNRTIPANGYGLYQNVVTGTFFAGVGAPACPSGPGCNFDFNLFGGSAISSFAPPQGAGETVPSAAGERGFVAAASNTAPLALSAGTLIGASSIFNPNTAGTDNFRGAGAALIFGFRFRDEADQNTLHYGWARITLPATGAGTLVDYAYSSVAGQAIAAGDVGGTNGGGLATVPEPSTYALVGAGLAGLGAVARRRRA